MTGIGYHPICVIRLSLIKNSTKSQLTGISVKFEQFGAVGIGQYGCVSTTLLKLQEYLSYSCIHSSNFFFFEAFSSEGNSFKGLGI